MIFEHLKI